MAETTILKIEANIVQNEMENEEPKKVHKNEETSSIHPTSKRRFVVWYLRWWLHPQIKITWSRSDFAVNNDFWEGRRTDLLKGKIERNDKRSDWVWE